MANGSMTPAGKPAWSRTATIGDYGGALDKRASDTEGAAPYAWFVYRELVAMRGSAYSKQLGGTLVHCENLALARVLAHRNFRAPEKFTCNAQQPATADEGLAYWAKVQAIPTKPSDQKWQIRQRCAAHFKALSDVNLGTIRTALQDLLGDAYVDATFITGSSLSSPPTQTYWPGINPGDSSLSLGGGAWTSERSHLWAQVQQPAGMTDAEYFQLIRVQAYQLLDRMLPAFCTFTVSEGGDAGSGEGFNLDIDRLDYTGLTSS